MILGGFPDPEPPFKVTSVEVSVTCPDPIMLTFETFQQVVLILFVWRLKKSSLSNTISHMINWLVVFYGVALRIMESQNWWFGDPKEPCKKHIQTLQNRRVQWFLRWTRENNKKHQHNTSELFWQFHGSQKKTHQLAPSREIHHVGKMTVSHSITPTQQDARFLGNVFQQITRWWFFATQPSNWIIYFPKFRDESIL